MNNEDIQALRAHYVNQVIRREDLKSDAYVQFLEWFQEAVDSEILEPNAMTLATVGHGGVPSARVLLFKGITDRQGLAFYTNYDSRKSREIEGNPFGAMVFNWLPMARQIRIAGRLAKLPQEESKAYFHSRPRGSQIGAWASIQSEMIENRDVLEQKLLNYQKKFENEKIIPLPPNWGGYELIPNRFEFWQGNADRLHDRFVYDRIDIGWSIYRLSP